MKEKETCKEKIKINIHHSIHHQLLQKNFMHFLAVFFPYFLTFYFEMITNIDKNCKNSTIKFPIHALSILSLSLSPNICITTVHTQNFLVLPRMSFLAILFFKSKIQSRIIQCLYL